MKTDSRSSRLFPLPSRLIFLQAIIIIFVLSGCYYYKVDTKIGFTPEDLRWAEFNRNYMILHSGDKAWHLDRTEITGEQFSGLVTALPESRLQYLTCDPEDANRYRHSKKEITLDQVHLYTKNPLFPEIEIGERVTIPFSAMNKTETYLKDKGATAVSWVVPIAGSIVAVGAAVGIIAAMTSCPVVYIKSNDDFKLVGEVFGGAVYASLERHDYLPLPVIMPSCQGYTLKIANELAEIQHINLAELWIVSHPENVTVLPDRRGSVHTVGDPRSPVKAVSTAKRDLAPMLVAKDKQRFLFDEEPSLTGDTNAFNSVVMTFSVPEGADSGKLVIKAGNQLWGDFVYGEFIKLFGSKYDEWIKSQRKVPAEKNIRWKLDQRFVLSVYLETDTGWRFVDYFDLIGALGEREMIMSLSLERTVMTQTPEHGRTVRIKLESGFKFWELDYAAMDFSENVNIGIHCAKPASATTESDKDVTGLLLENDRKYYVQNHTGEEAVVLFPEGPETLGMKKSVILHVAGYYEHVRDYPGPPDKKLLGTFATPGRLSQYSLCNYREFVKAKAVLVAEPVLP